MSKYNVYAQRLDTAFKEARDEYTAAYTALQQAQQANREAGAWRSDDSAEEKQRRVTRAALAVHDAEAAFSEASARVWPEFNRKRRAIRTELEKEIGAASIADPAAIDNNALELMKTGVLSAADYSAFVEKYDSNATMLKLIAHYAHEAAGATENRQEAAALNSIAVTCQSGQGAVLRAWDDLSKVADYCSGQKYDGAREQPTHIVNMSARWEQFSGAVENF